MAKKPELSIVILSYNTKDVIKNCLNSLQEVKGEVDFEIIVSDNGSKDNSVEMLRKDYPEVRVYPGKNVGFAAGNNRVKDKVKGKLILFLNPDTIVHKNTLRKTVKYLKEHKNVGALTCKLVLPNGELDKDTRRSFPSPWVSFSHLVLRADRLFPKSKFFARYWYGYISEDKTHHVDALQGAFFLSWKKILDKVGWFDEGYFFDGEDMDLSWQIKKAGYDLVYYPKVSITHLKGVTKGKIKNRKIPLEQRMRARMSGMNSMERFYRKNLWDKYPLVYNLFVITGIKIFKFFRWMGVIYKHLLSFLK